MGRDIRVLISENGYSVRSFAAHIGLPHTTLYNALTRNLDDQRNMSHRIFRAIAHGFGMTVDELDLWIEEED